MSARTYYDLTCDHPGCLDHPKNGMASSVREARAFAREEGWVVKRVKNTLFDYCAKHKEGK